MLTSPETYRADPAQAWRRLAGRMRKPREIAVLMEVAAWREREAQTRNVPRGRILKDEAVIDVATAAPRSVEALGRLRTIPAGFERSRTGADILAAVERGFARDTAEIAIPERSRGRGGGNGALVELSRSCSRRSARPRASRRKSSRPSTTSRPWRRTTTPTCPSCTAGDAASSARRPSPSRAAASPSRLSAAASWCATCESPAKRRPRATARRTESRAADLRRPITLGPPTASRGYGALRARCRRATETGAGGPGADAARR